MVTLCQKFAIDAQLKEEIGMQFGTFVQLFHAQLNEFDLNFDLVWLNSNTFSSLRAKFENRSYTFLISLSNVPGIYTGSVYGRILIGWTAR